jgi:anti-sigma28 factor (negative regulator of flagellin synthesis)
MRIPGKISAPDRAVRADRAKDVGKKGGKVDPKSAAGAGASDGVTSTVSTRARELAGSSAIDVPKVNQLRELIESGRFVMDFQLIAERIVSTGG